MQRSLCRLETTIAFSDSLTDIPARTCDVPDGILIERGGGTDAHDHLEKSSWNVQPRCESGLRDLISDIFQSAMKKLIHLSWSLKKVGLISVPRIPASLYADEAAANVNVA